VRNTNYHLVYTQQVEMLIKVLLLHNYFRIMLSYRFTPLNMI